MLIAIDYDNTYSADPVLWKAFIRNAKDRGHQVICVCQRRDTIENRKEIKEGSMDFIPVYLTGMSSKVWFMEQGGISVDIWIDDDPRALVEGK